MQSSTSLIALCLLIAALPVRAEQAQVTELPSDELLDFLGQWEQVDGEWLDPTQLQEISMLEQDSFKGESNED